MRALSRSSGVEKEKRMSESEQRASTPAAQSAAGIDHEHALQFRLFEALTQSIERHEDWRPIFDQAADFSRAHFLSEELLMRLYDYEDFDDHVADHERMLAWLDEFASAPDGDAGRLHAVKELTALFLRHVGGRDRRLNDYLNDL